MKKMLFFISAFMMAATCLGRTTQEYFDQGNAKYTSVEKRFDPGPTLEVLCLTNQLYPEKLIKCAITKF